MANRFLAPTESLSNQSMVHSFMVQDPYGTGQPEFMNSGAAPSHFIRQGLSGQPYMVGEFDYAPLTSGLGEFDYAPLTSGLGDLRDVARGHWKTVLFGAGAIVLTALLINKGRTT